MFPWFRWDAPLFFASAELFHERVLDLLAAIRAAGWWCVVAAEAVTSVDLTAPDIVGSWMIPCTPRASSYALPRVARPEGRL